MLKIIDRSGDDGLCYYYLENDIAGGDMMESHLHWHNVLNNFKNTLGFKSDDEALAFLKRCISLSQEMQSIISGNHHKEAFLKSILL